MFKPLNVMARPAVVGPSLSALAGRETSGFTPNRWLGVTEETVIQSATSETIRSADWNAGFAASLAERHDAASSSTERKRIELSFMRLDTEQSALLASRLRNVVVALCGSVIDLGIADPAAIERRIQAATALLRVGDEAPHVSLHPDDLVLVADRLPVELTLVADQTLERGAVRIDTPGGGIEDGPDNWRRAIEAAVHAC